MANHCGYCVASESQANEHITAVDLDGRALRIDWGYGNGNQDLRFVNGSDSAWQPVVAPFFGEGRGVVVFSVQASTMPSATWMQVHDALANYLARAQDPRPTRQCCVVDGPSVTLAAEGRNATLDDNQDDAGWSQVRAQMTTLHDWL